MRALKNATKLNVLINIAVEASPSPVARVAATNTLNINMPSNESGGMDMSNAKAKRSRSARLMAANIKCGTAVRMVLM